MTHPGDEGSRDERATPSAVKDAYRQQLIDSIGGWQGALITAIPPAVFVIVNATAGLTPAIVAALVVAAALVAYRLLRKQSIQQALSGALGVGVGALIAARTGQARGYFLLGIWGSFVYAVPFAVSVLVRRPLVGLIWEFLDPTPPETVRWYKRRPLLRAYVWATLICTALFLARGLVQLALYHRNATGWLAFTRIAMGYPLTVVGLGASYLLVTRARSRLKQSAGPAMSGGTAEPADV